ncbi:hypothetical protein [Aporhodopirellula aestuarii]|uniref:Secreted protein n=1 Tax=Aporhodopirellula aestuarii TaxID=2950107 RepID=A0ABT0UDF8_9BACT|nr:hypothetical protein [Aporhodopirellula aestuarii]MCM2374769.1 hypothetical protein [Aporhodopirellula aestuarii]
MRTILCVCLLVACSGCGNSQPGTEGTAQDDIAAYIEANPNVDAGLDEIDESDDGTGE